MDARDVGCRDDVDIEPGDEGKLLPRSDSFSSFVGGGVDAVMGSASFVCSFGRVTSSGDLAGGCDAVSIAIFGDNNSAVPEVDPVVESDPVEDMESLDEFEPGDFNWLLFSVMGAGEEARGVSTATSISLSLSFDSFNSFDSLFRGSWGDFVESGEVILAE